MPTWDTGVIADIPKLLSERRAIAADNWYHSAPSKLGLGRHPYERTIKKNLEEISNQIVADERVEQVQFQEKVKAEYKRQLLYAQGSPDVDEWHRSRKVEKVKKNFSGSGIEAMPE